MPGHCRVETTIYVKKKAFRAYSTRAHVPGRKTLFRFDFGVHPREGFFYSWIQNCRKGYFVFAPPFGCTF